MQSQYRWRRHFAAAVDELCWSSAALVVSANKRTDADSFLNEPSSLKALLDFLDDAPVAEQSLLQRTVAIAGVVDKTSNLQAWQVSLKKHLWAVLLHNLVVGVAGREYRETCALGEMLGMIPAPSSDEIRAFRRCVIMIASTIGARERNLCAGTCHIAVNVDAATPAIDVLGGADLVLSDLATFIEAGGLSHEHVFVLRAAYRRAWWPTWRRMQWLWMLQPQLRPLLRELESRPGKAPAGAAEHLKAVLQRREFPSAKASWDDV